MVAENDREAFIIALQSCGHTIPGEERIIRIKDTLHLNTLYVSEKVLDEVISRPDIESDRKKVTVFNLSGNLNPF